MNNAELKAYKVTKIDFNNRVRTNVQLNFSHKVSYNVKYNSNGTCEGDLTVSVVDEENPDVLNIKVVVTGLFEIKKRVEKEFIHVETFKELFPFAKALVATISVNAGVPPIIVKNVNIDDQQIFRFNLKNKKRPDGDDE